MPAAANSGLGFLLGGEDSQRGGRKGGTGELYSLASRDGVALKSRRQLVEGGRPSLLSLGQQRKPSF
jgi:hypothetical protein